MTKVLKVTLGGMFESDAITPVNTVNCAGVMGDALAVALIEKRQFKPHDFAVFHPGGSLGRRLLTRVKDVMHVNVPKIAPDGDIREAIKSIAQGGLDLGVSVDTGKVCGVITDGDLRRALFNYESLDGLKASDIMTHAPLTISEDEMFADAKNLMLKFDVTALLVVNKYSVITGVLKLQDAKRLG